MAPSIRWWPRGRLSWSALFTAWPIPSSIRPSACRPVWSRFDRTGVVSARVPAAAPRGCSRVPPRPMSHLLVLRMSSWVPYPSLRSRRLVYDDVAVGVGAAAHHHRVLVPITINERSHPSIRALPPSPWGPVCGLRLACPALPCHCHAAQCEVDEDGPFGSLVLARQVAKRRYAPLPTLPRLSPLLCPHPSSSSTPVTQARLHNIREVGACRDLGDDGTERARDQRHIIWRPRDELSPPDCAWARPTLSDEILGREGVDKATPARWTSPWERPIPPSVPFPPPAPQRTP
jgi:hypothetical protein